MVAGGAGGSGGGEGRTLGEEGGAALLHHPDGSRQLVLLTNREYVAAGGAGAPALLELHLEATTGRNDLLGACMPQQVAGRWVPGCRGTLLAGPCRPHHLPLRHQASFF